MESIATNHLHYESKDHIHFDIRANATRRDQSELNIAMSETAKVEEGRIIRVSPLSIYPWLVERFVVSWSGGDEKAGKDILAAIYLQPADPEEDLVMVLGAYIFMHVKGLTITKDDAAKKKG